MSLFNRSGSVATPVSTTIYAQITRADGTVEPRRVVGYSHRNPLRTLIFKLTKKVV